MDIIDKASSLFSGSRRFAHVLLESLFPPRCLICSHTPEQGQCICESCRDELPENAHYCKRCALPLLAPSSGYSLCGRCIKKFPSFDYALSPWRYEQAVIGLVQQMKFNDKVSFARALGQLLCTYYRRAVPTAFGAPDSILPVPLHPSRLRQRGYNQSIELSRALAHGIQVPIDVDGVRRIRKTPAQMGLNARFRVSNIRGAFRAMRTYEGEHVLIVDDVMTTGSTVDELAGVLKAEGACTVGVLCLARAPLK